MNNIVERVHQSNIYIQPIHFLLVILTNIINIRILSCRALRSSLCTYYFLAYAILGIMYTCFLSPIQFARGFSINLTNNNLTCKVSTYFLFVLPLQANIMLILASFDRYYSSSHLSHYHSINRTIRIARQNIFIGNLFCIVFMIPMLFIYTWDEKLNKCLAKSHLSIQIYICSQVFIYYILSPLLMIVFGMLTIYNIHQQSNHSVTFILSKRRRRTECQLAQMLFLQITVHLILVLPFGIIYIINSLIPSTQRPNIIAIRLIFVIWQHCDYFVSFFLYVLSANIYRQQLIRILKSIKYGNRISR